MNNDQHSLNLVSDLLKQKYQPDLWAEEQEKKKKKLAETLLFVEGVLAGLEAAKGGGK